MHVGNEDCHISDNFCGAMMTYIFYKRWDSNVARLKNFCEIAQDYDMWILSNPERSFAYNNLFWMYSPYVFLERFKDGNIILTQDEKIKIIAQKKDFKKYFSDLMLLELPCKGIFCVCEKYLSDVSYKLQQMGYNYYLMYNGKSNISFRSRTDDIDCIKITTSLGIGGGHLKASGIPCNSLESAKEITKKVVKLICQK